MARFTHISGKRRIFTKVRQVGVCSRAELSRLCSLTRPAVSSVVDELIAEGYIREIGSGRSTGGKPPILLEFCSDARCAIGIELGGDRKISGVLCNLSGAILADAEEEYENSFDSILEVITHLVTKLSAAAPAGVTPAGIGLAVSAIVDAELNEAVHSSLDICRKNIAQKLSQNTALPVRLERRPNAAALAEALFGAGRDVRELICITSGVGIGAGVVIDGEIYRGRHGGSGEIGRVLLPDARALEEEARPSEMLRKYREESGVSLDFETFMKKYLAGDPVATLLMQRNAAQLAYAAAVAANLFDPDAIVLGGDALEFGDAYFDLFRDQLEQVLAARVLGTTPKILRCHFGRRGVAVGGAQIILDELVL